MENQPTIEQQEPQAAPIVRESRLWLIIALAVAVTAVVVGGGMWWWMNGKLETEQQKFSQQMQVLEEQTEQMASSDATANWKTYSSQTYGFEIMYPEQYTVSTSDPNYNIVFGTSTHRGTYRISFINNPNSLTAKEYLDSIYGDPNAPEAASVPEPTPITTQYGDTGSYFNLCGPGGFCTGNTFFSNGNTLIKVEYDTRPLFDDFSLEQSLLDAYLRDGQKMSSTFTFFDN